MKAILIADHGGQCQRCGYEGSQAALQFHHVDQATKAFGISARGLTYSLTRMRAEAAKCMLLCANCHAEVDHYAA